MEILLYNIKFVMKNANPLKIFRIIELFLSHYNKSSLRAGYGDDDDDAQDEDDFTDDVHRVKVGSL